MVYQFFVLFSVLLILGRSVVELNTNLKEVV